MWKKRTQTDYGWQRAHQKPEENPDKQFVKLVAARTKWWRVIRIIEFILVIYLVGAIVNQPTAPKPIVPDFNPTGKQAAYASVETWLTHGDPLGEGAHIVSWDGSQPYTLSDGHTQANVRTHDLTVENKKNRWWKVHVTVTDNGIPVAGVSANPLPPISQSQPDTTLSWADTLNDLQPSAALQTLVTQWGQAWMSTDPDRLKVVVSDPDANATYQPLMLGSAQSTTIDHGAYLKRGKINREGNTSDTAVLRVSVTLHEKAETQAPTKFVYDLLVSNPDGTPHVLAWGAPGQGPTLPEYANRWHDALMDANTLNINEDGKDKS